MTTADFASYTAIVFGDRTCAVGTSTLATAEATKGTWSRAVTGPVYVQGADPQYHASYREEARHMIAAGLNFAAHGYRTGLYASLSCYYAGAPRYTTVDFLSEVGHFEVGPQEGCPNTVNVLHPGHPAMAGQTDAGLSNWGCTAHDLLLVYPAGFHALATVVRPSDGAVLPFIVARGGPFGP